MKLTTKQLKQIIKEEIKSLKTESLSNLGGGGFESVRALIELLLDSKEVEYNVRDGLTDESVIYIFGDQPETGEPGYLVRDDLVDGLKNHGIREWTGAIGYKKQNIPSWSTSTKRKSGETKWIHELTLHRTN